MFSESSFGFATATRFTDIQITLCADGRFWVYDNGVPFREMVRRGMTKEKLAEGPVVGFHPGLHGMLELGWDPEPEIFYARLNQIPHYELDKYVRQVKICRQKVLHTDEGNVRQTLWFLLFGIKSVVVQSSYNKNKKAVLVTVGAKTQILKRGRFDDPDIYPINLIYNELNWKLSVNFDFEEDCFTLCVNEQAVTDLPYQATTAPDGPMLVMNNSKIFLNGKQINMIDAQWSVEQFKKEHKTKLGA